MYHVLKFDRLYDDCLNSAED